MNLIVICLDTFRQDHVSFYHGGKGPFADVPACRTPNIDAFAQECVVFDNVYPCGMPTIPIRMELMTGQFTLPYRGWQPLAPTDIPVAEILRRFTGTDAFPFCMVSTTSAPSGTERCWDSFTQAELENAESRVLAGFHFRFAIETGVNVGRKIGQYATRHALRPLNRSAQAPSCRCSDLRPH